MYHKISLFLLMAAMAVSTVLTGCNKDDDDNGGGAIAGNKLTVTVSGVGDKVDEVRLYADGATLATAEFKNNSFTLELPNPVAAQYLDLLSEDMPDGVTISAKDAKGCSINEISAYKDDMFVGEFYYENYDGDNEIDVYFYYMDRDVTITGKYEDPDYIQQFSNCNLKKGWNYVADIYKGEDSSGKSIYEMTTSIPSGVKWVFSGGH